MIEYVRGHAPDKEAAERTIAVHRKSSEHPGRCERNLEQIMFADMARTTMGLGVQPKVAVKK